MKFVLGLTGQTGAGKSSLKSIAEKLGYFVIDCDIVAHAELEKDEAKAALVSAFSADILNADGTLSRSALAARAFESEEKTELLNSTVLPFIVKEINAIIEKTGADKILLDAPTLYESGADSMCDFVIAVTADSLLRKKRIIERDKLTDAQAQSRINAGKSVEFYKERANVVIKNNGNLEEFQNEFEYIINNIRG